VVARDGIEPPTPAFSGLDSFTAMMLKLKAESCLDGPKTTHLLGQEWDKILADQNFLSHCCLFRSSISGISSAFDPARKA
jgi:hypothetical protein